MDPREQLLAMVNDETAHPAERALSEALLHGFDCGELLVLADVETGKLLFALKPTSEQVLH
jgi:hypothetical protein